MASQRHAAISVFWATLERAATQGISFIVVLILARILGPTDYGLVTLAATIALLGQLLLGETFSEALIQREALEDAHASSIFWLLAAVGLAAGAAIFLFAELCAGFFGEPALAPVLRALSLLLPLSALQAVPTALFKRAFNFRALAIASASGTLLGGVVGIALALAHFGLWSLVANLLVQNTVVTASIWTRSGFRPEFSISRRHLADLWAYGQYTLLLRIALFAANQSPRLIVGYLFGPGALGAFGLAQRVTDVAYQLFIVPAANVTVPVIARVRDEPQRLERAILATTQLVAMVAMPVFVGLALLAPTVVPLVFGAKWLAAIPMVQIVALAGIVGSTAYIYRSIVGGLGRPGISLINTVTGAFFSVGMMLAAAPWGLIAATAVFAIRGCLTLPLQPVVLARLTAISLWRQYAVYVPIVAATAIMIPCVEGVIALTTGALSPFWQTLAAVLSGGTAYLLCLYLVAPTVVERCCSLLSEFRARPSAVQRSSG